MRTEIYRVGDTDKYLIVDGRTGETVAEIKATEDQMKAIAQGLGLEPVQAA